jgi:hypothetical protein
MSNRYSDTLYQLVQSLEKAEKRHFKLYINRNSANQDLKIVKLFDALDKLTVYDEKVLLKKLSPITKTQLYNLKAHLYKEVLASLRLLKTGENIDLQLSEHLDNARLLYNKGLKIQSLRILEKAKDLARSNHKFNTLVQLLSLEKKIETLHITRSDDEKIERLAEEALENSRHIERVTRVSNLALLLNRWYIKNGHARNEADEKRVREYFRQYLPQDVTTIKGFYEELYYYQCCCWDAFIRQDFVMYYRYSQKWVDLFYTNEVMQTVETGHYIKGMHTLLNSLFDLRHFGVFEKVLQQFETFAETPVAQQHDNFRTHISIYINTARINKHLMQGTFKEGAALVPQMDANLADYSLYVDQHRIVVFNYKFASLYFGSGDYDTCIDYLQKIIHNDIGLRYDLQCYARLMHLLAHYEKGNYDIMEHLTKSVYRFMAKMKNLTVVEEAMFRFLKHSLGVVAPNKLQPELEKFLNTIKHLEKNRFETRSFAYLDIISWVESKVHHKTMEQVVYDKYLKSKRK